MKSFITIVFFISSFCSFGQTDKRGTIKVKKVETVKADTISSREIFAVTKETPAVTAPLTIVEEMPFYKGGKEAMNAFIQKNIKYPIAEKNAKIQGTVFITFIVEVDGSLSGVGLLRGIAVGCDTEALRIVKLMPKWVPGKQKGKTVPVAYTLPIKFSLK
jgi:periplasmic protein TonB